MLYFVVVYLPAKLGYLKTKINHLAKSSSLHHSFVTLHQHC
jgi:hypothetical protein